MIVFYFLLFYEILTEIIFRLRWFCRITRYVARFIRNAIIRWFSCWSVNTIFARFDLIHRSNHSEIARTTCHRDKIYRWLLDVHQFLRLYRAKMRYVPHSRQRKSHEISLRARGYCTGNSGVRRENVTWYRVADKLRARRIDRSWNPKEIPYCAFVLSHYSDALIRLFRALNRTKLQYAWYAKPPSRTNPVK